jgi:hypothetical protein
VPRGGVPLPDRRGAAHNAKSLSVP